MMEKVRIANSLLVIGGLVCLLALGVTSPARAASEHAVTVKIEFVDNPSCSDKTIVLGAASCDGDEIATELMTQMNMQGFAWVLCAWVPAADEWQCGYIPPAGCQDFEIEVSALAGSDCPTNSARAEYQGTYGFGFDLE